MTEMQDDNLLTPKVLAQGFDIPLPTIYNWIRLGKIPHIKKGDLIFLERDKVFNSTFSAYINKRIYREPEPYFPNELTKYHDWHQTLDKLSWLFKVCYTTQSDIKKKRFNLRTIFENYLTQNKIELAKIKNCFQSPGQNKQLITDDLKRGWYNELSFLYPLKTATLGLSFRDINTNLKISSSRFSFASWKITQSYYSFFFYMRSITLYKNTNFRIEEHKATLNSFKNNAFDSLKKSCWKFPLDIYYKSGKRFYLSNTPISKIDFLKHNYCKHPRVPQHSPKQITKEIYTEFKNRGKQFGKQINYTLFDYLLEFRIWANYLDIDNLLSLYSDAFKTFLDQNLSLILFFVGGLTELIYISIYGEKEYIKELQNLYDLFAKNNNEIKDNFIYSSLFQRMKIYKYSGIINSEIIIDSVINENEILLQF